MAKSVRHRKSTARSSKVRKSPRKTKKVVRRKRKSTSSKRKKRKTSKKRKSKVMRGGDGDELIIENCRIVNEKLKALLIALYAGNLTRNHFEAQKEIIMNEDTSECEDIILNKRWFSIPIPNINQI